MNQLRLCQFSNGSHGFVHAHADGTSNVYYGVKPMDEVAAAAAMLAHQRAHTPTAAEGATPVGPEIGEPFEIDWTPPTLPPGTRGTIFQKGFTAEMTAMHVPAVTPSDTPKGDAPPKLEYRPLPPV